jgi:hypothetical protein
VKPQRGCFYSLSKNLLLMVRCKKMFCTKRLFDRDFLYGVFPNAGFVKDPEELFQVPGENIHGEREPDDNKCCGTDEEPGL